MPRSESERGGGLDSLWFDERPDTLSGNKLEVDSNSKLVELKKLMDAGEQQLFGGSTPKDEPVEPKEALERYIQTARGIIENMRNESVENGNDKALQQANFFMTQLVSLKELVDYPAVMSDLKRLNELYKGGLYLFGPKAKIDDHVLRMADKYLDEALEIRWRLQGVYRQNLDITGEKLHAASTALSRTELMIQHLLVLRDQIQLRPKYQHPGLNTPAAFDQPGAKAVDVDSGLSERQLAEKLLQSHLQEIGQHRREGAPADLINYYVNRVLPEDLQRLLAACTNEEERSKLKTRYQEQIDAFKQG